MNFFNDEWELFIKHCGFTDIELDIVQLLRRGWYEVDIAAELNMSPSTVTRKKRSIKRKIIHFIENSS
jgi:DNA-binding NarL/FixJ family response regulator